MRPAISSYLPAVPLVALALLGGCGGGDGAPTAGQVSVAVTNPPMDEARSVIEYPGVGTIEGEVAAALVHDETCTGAAVYVWEGSDAVPVDVSGTDYDPLAIALVRKDEGTGAYVYRAAFLPEGAYTLAFTCQAADDDPEEPDTLTFVGLENVAVATGVNAVHNFE
jgi:hypothetical protein